MAPNRTAFLDEAAATVKRLDARAQGAHDKGRRLLTDAVERDCGHQRVAAMFVSLLPLTDAHQERTFKVVCRQKHSTAEHTSTTTWHTNASMYEAYPTNFTHPPRGFPSFYNNYPQPIHRDAYQPRGHDANAPRYGGTGYNYGDVQASRGVHSLPSCDRVPPLSHPPFSQNADEFWAPSNNPDGSATLHHFPPTPPPSTGPLVLPTQDKNPEGRQSSVPAPSVSKGTSSERQHLFK